MGAYANFIQATFISLQELTHFTHCWGKWKVCYNNYTNNKRVGGFMPEIIDTLRIYERLRESELTDRASKEIAEVIKEMLEGNLATKRELKEVEAALKVDIEKLRSELKSDIEKLRSDTEKIRSELKSDIEKLRSELKSDIEKLRSELKSDIEKLRSELKIDIERTKSDTVKWVAGLLIGQAALIITLLKLIP